MGANITKAQEGRFLRYRRKLFQDGEPQQNTKIKKGGPYLLLRKSDSSQNLYDGIGSHFFYKSPLSARERR